MKRTECPDIYIGLSGGWAADKVGLSTCPLSALSTEQQTENRTKGTPKKSQNVHP